MYKVLIVDDEVTIRKGLENGVDWAVLDCEIIGTAENANQALEQMKRTRPDILLSDINMSGLNGIELFSAALSICPTLKCIFITGIYDFEYAYNALKYGATDLLLKPTSPAKIKNAVAKAIASLRVDREHTVLTEQLKQQQDQNLRLKQSIFLSNIAEGYDVNEPTCTVLDNLQLSFERFVVIAVTDNQASFEERAANEKLIHSYIELVFESVSRWCYFKNGMQTMIFVNDSSTVSIRETVRRYCTELSDMVDNLTGTFISIGISSVHTGAERFHIAVEEADCACKVANFDAKGALVEFTELPPISMSVFDQMKKSMDDLLHAIELLDLSGAQVVLAEIVDFWVEHCVPFSECRNLGVLIHNVCMKQLWFYNGSGIDLLAPRAAYHHGSQKCNNVRELGDYLLQMISSTISSVDNPATVLDNITTFIAQNYNTDLSLEKIAATFHFSAGYLSRMFKLQKGVNLSSYIQEVRIEQAKKLIQTTSLRTYEIAERVGINDPIYFSKLFKKCTGYRVRDYKLLNNP